MVRLITVDVFVSADYVSGMVLGTDSQLCKGGETEPLPRSYSLPVPYRDTREATECPSEL